MKSSRAAEMPERAQERPLFAQRSEEFPDVRCQRLRFLERREVSAFGHHCPTLHVEESFGPFARRMGNILGEKCEGRWRFGRPDPPFSRFLQPSYAVCVHDVVRGL